MGIYCVKHAQYGHFEEGTCVLCFYELREDLKRYRAQAEKLTEGLKRISEECHCDLECYCNHTAIADAYLADYKAEKGNDEN